MSYVLHESAGAGNVTNTNITGGTSYRCNRLKCPRLDGPPACKLRIGIIRTPYRFIP